LQRTILFFFEAGSSLLEFIILPTLPTRRARTRILEFVLLRQNHTTTPHPFVVVLSVSSQVLGHALIEPAIGVTGAGARADVQRPSAASPCGTVDVATALKTSTAVAANNGAFTVNVQNFNAGKDGSTEITSSSVDTTATGKSFAGQVTITTNGVEAPTTVGTVQVSGTLPAGTTCTGGDGSQCLVSFTTAGGFGNCVLVSQGGAAAGAAANTTVAATTAAAAAPAATPAKAAGGKGGKGGKAAKGGKGKAAPAAGARLAREVRAREEAGELVARDAQSWVWVA